MVLRPPTVNFTNLKGLAQQMSAIEIDLYDDEPPRNTKAWEKWWSRQRGRQDIELKAARAEEEKAEAESRLARAVDRFALQRIEELRATERQVAATSVALEKARHRSDALKAVASLEKAGYVTPFEAKGIRNRIYKSKP